MCLSPLRHRGATYSTTSSPKPDSAVHVLRRADMTLIRRTPRSRRICAPVPNVRRSMTRSRRAAGSGGSGQRSHRAHELTRALLVPQDHDDASGLLATCSHRIAQRPAEPRVADADDVAERVLEVDTNERRGVRVELPAHEREVHVTVDVVLEADHAERPKAVSIGFPRSLDGLARSRAGTDEVGDRADLELVALRELRRDPSRRAIVPSSLRISTMTAAGSSPASRARSQPASVCPARVSTPPGCAISGKMWPGWRRSSGRARERRPRGSCARGRARRCPSSRPRPLRSRR